MSEFVFEKDSLPRTRIKVVGIGGGGCNAVDSMVSLGLPEVEFFAVNTDLQALSSKKCPNKIHIGQDVLSGKGTGGDPVKGEQAAVADRDLLTDILQGGDMAFIAACLGGGTGTGAAPVVAQLAREMGLLTVAIVTKPFQFEGPQRRNRAQQGIDRLREFVDALIIVMNDKLLEAVGAKTPLLEAFSMVNQILAQGVQSISDLISMPGLINADFEDVRSVMGATGGAVLGVGIGKGENRAVEAVKKACSATLQEKIVIDGAKRVLISLTGGADMTLHEVNDAASLVYEAADPDANIILSAVIDERLTDEIRVTIMATGFGEEVKIATSPLGARDRIAPPVQPRPVTAPPAKPARGTGLSASTVAAEFSRPPARPQYEDEIECDELRDEPRGSLSKGMAEPFSTGRKGEARMRLEEPEYEMKPMEAPEPVEIAKTLPSWSDDFDPDSIDELRPASAVRGAEDSANLEAEEGDKHNYEIPAIIRRRKSFFS